MFDLNVLHHFVALKRDCVLLPLPFVCTLPHQKRPVARNILHSRKKKTQGRRVGWAIVSTCANATRPMPSRSHREQCCCCLLHCTAARHPSIIFRNRGGKQNILQEIGWRKTVRGARHERCAGVETANANHTCSRLTASSREMVPWKYLSCVGVKW